MWCRNGLVAQLGAHHIRIVGVGSSNLLKSTSKKDRLWAVFLLGGQGDSNNQESDMPVACCCHQFKNW